MKRALVTGAAGFVGANLARRLVVEGHDVHLLLRPGTRTWRLDPPLDTQVHEADLADAEAVSRAAGAARPEWVFHCAAYGAYSWQRDAVRMRETNVTGTANLLAACRRAGCQVFINTGSSSEYGCKSHPAAETHVPEPNSPYAQAKLAATEHCAAEARRHGGAVITLRLYSVYGPYEEPNRLMPSLLAAGFNGVLPPLADPRTARDFVYVDDVCDAYLVLAENPPDDPGAIFNVGTGTQTTLADAVALVRAMFRIAAEPQWGSMPARSWDTNVWCADIRKITAQTGWTPRYPLAEGLERFRAWLVDHPQVRERYEAAVGGGR